MFLVGSVTSATGVWMSQRKDPTLLEVRLLRLPASDKELQVETLLWMMIKCSRSSIFESKLEDPLTTLELRWLPPAVDEDWASVFPASTDKWRPLKVQEEDDRRLVGRHLELTTIEQ